MTDTQTFSLLDLPLELVFMIDDFLSPADTVCLALCNHRLMISLNSAVATTSRHLDIRLESLLRLSRLKSADTVCVTVRYPKATMDHSPASAVDFKRLQMRRDFLTRISRDVERRYFCFSCYTLHPWHIVNLPSTSISSPKCSTNGLLPRNRLIFGRFYPCYINLKFDFVHVQLAMRRFYYGRASGIDPDKLRYTAISIWPLDIRRLCLVPEKLAADQPAAKLRKGFMTSLFSIEARVCPAAPEPGLCLRIQEIAQGSRENNGRMFLLAAHRETTMAVCRHINVGSAEYESEPRGPETMQFDPAKIIKSLIARFSSGADHHPVCWQTCHKCGITWKLELRLSQDDNEIFLVSTRWLDLGPGISPEDWQWKMHSGYYSILSEDTGDYELLNARSRFETESIQTSPSEEELFHRNSSLLKRQNYRKLMTRRVHQVGIWLDRVLRRVSRVVI